MAWRRVRSFSLRCWRASRACRFLRFALRRARVSAAADMATGEPWRLLALPVPSLTPRASLLGDRISEVQWRMREGDVGRGRGR